jgi:hypothetical protein
MRQLFNDLTLAQLTPEQNKQTCNYWFIVQSGGMAHTAFRTKDQLEQWLIERNITLTKELVPHGQHSFQKLNGSYFKFSFMNYNSFYSLNYIQKTKQMDNGRETLALITEEDGIRTINYLNCNMKFRIEYDYRTGAMITNEEYNSLLYRR